MTHSTSAYAAPSPLWIDGTATFTTVMSMSVMKAPASITTSASQRCGYPVRSEEAVMSHDRREQRHGPNHGQVVALEAQRKGLVERALAVAAVAEDADLVQVVVVGAREAVVGDTLSEIRAAEHCPARAHERLHVVEHAGLLGERSRQAMQDVSERRGVVALRLQPRDRFEHVRLVATRLVAAQGLCGRVEHVLVDVEQRDLRRLRGEAAAVQE